LMVWSYDGTATVFDRDGAEVTSVGRNSGLDFFSAALSPDGSHVAAEGREQSSSSALQSSLIIWDTRSGRIIHRVRIPGGVTFVAFDPTGRSVAAARTDGQVEVREVESGDLVRRFATHSSGLVLDLVYSPDGSLIAIASDDSTVRIYDAQRGEQQLVLRGHGFLVSGVSFSPDGTMVASASPDGLVRVWALDLDDLIRIARGEVKRGLSDEECIQYLHLEAGCP